MKTVLIVEDDLKTKKIYSDKLISEGFSVSTYAAGKEALVFARQNKPDLILLDIMLPGKLSGFDVLEALKKDPDLQKVPVLVLTNLGTEAKVAKEIGAVDYLIKANSSLEDIIRKIKSLVS